MVSDDPATVEALLRLCTAAEVAVDVADDLDTFSPGIHGSSVLLGAELFRADVARWHAALAGVSTVVVAVGHAPGLREAAAAGGWQLAVLPADEHEVLRFLAHADCGPGALVVVVGGSGGCGATTLACALAVTGARELAGGAALVDADPWGGGVDLVLGAEAEPGLRWEQLAAVHGPLPPDALLSALPTVHGLAVLGFGREHLPDVPPEALTAVLGALRRRMALTVVDAGRVGQPGTEVALGSADDCLVVVSGSVAGIAAAARATSWLRSRTGALRLVVREPLSGLSTTTVADLVGAPVAGVLRTDPRARLAADRGEPPGSRRRAPLAQLCRGLLRDLAVEKRGAASPRPVRA